VGGYGSKPTNSWKIEMGGGFYFMPATSRYENGA